MICVSMMVTAADEVPSADGRARVDGLAMTSWRSGFLSSVLGEGIGGCRLWRLEGAWTGCEDDALAGGGDPDEAASEAGGEDDHHAGDRRKSYRGGSTVDLARGGGRLASAPTWRGMAGLEQRG